MSSRADVCSLIIERHTAQEVEGYLVDVWTAQALMAVYRGLKPESRAKFDEIPLPRLVDFAWKHVRTA